MKEAASDVGGAITMGPGTLYGSLDRMAQSGLVEETGTTDDQRRRYYRITPFGRQVLRAETLRLKRALTSLSGRRVFSDGGEA